jgi:predicted DNA-binding ribbon-helix-helix protein
MQIGRWWSQEKRAGTGGRAAHYQGMHSAVLKRSVMLDGHKTSVSLEDEFWRGLKEIATARKITLSELIASLDRTRCQGNLSSALRLFILEFYRDQAEGSGSARIAA